ncbi:hypothetical protein ACNKHK_24730 [Shigella flexneri]
MPAWPFFCDLLIGSCLNNIIPNPQRVFVYVYSASVLRGWCRRL